MTKIVNKQFEILGLNLKFEDIPDSGVIQLGKKKDYWYNIYQFTEEQEAEWKDWALIQLANEEDPDKELRNIELLFGLPVRYKKSGELF